MGGGRGAWAMRNKNAIPILKVDVTHMRRRFLAWWEGVDLADLEPDDLAAPSMAPQTEQSETPSVIQYSPKVPQLAAHLTIAQALWGEGYLGPGDAAFILDLVSQFGISRDKSLAFVGLGLGGPAREICRESGIWISGFETRADLIEPASEQCLMAGLARKINVQHFDPVETALPPRKFHIIIVRDELHHMEHKERVIAQVYESLRPGGSILLTDYVVSDTGDPDMLADQAFSDFWGKPQLRAADEHVNLLTSVGFDVRVRKDISQNYVDLISASSHGWGALMKLIEDDDEQVTDRQTFLAALAQQAEMWSERLNALKNGQLQVYRFFALKPDEIS